MIVDYAVLTYQPLRLLFAVSLLLFWIYQGKPELRFLVVFHLLATVTEFFLLTHFQPALFISQEAVWHFQLLLLSNLIKVLLLLVAVSIHFSLLCLSLGQVLIAYGLLMLLQLPGLLQSGPMVDQPLFRDSYQITSQIVRIGLLITLSYPAIGAIRKRFRAIL